MMGMEEMLNMVSQYVTVLMDRKMITNMSMVFTVWCNGVYDTMTGIDGAGSGLVAGSSVVQMVACGITTSFTFSYQLVQI